jgi:hypothetical protein
MKLEVRKSSAKSNKEQNVLEEPSRKNFKALCDKLYELLQNSNSNSKNQTLLKESNIINKMFAFVKNDNIIKFDILDSNCCAEDFLLLVNDIHMSKNQELIEQIVGSNAYEWILDLYVKKKIGIMDEHSEGYADRRSVMLTFYILAKYNASYVETLLKQNFIDKIIQQLSFGDRKQKYGKFRSLMEDICELTGNIGVSSFVPVCKKFIDLGLVEKLENLYNLLQPDDVSTKCYIVNVLINLIDNGFLDHKIIKFLLSILQMKEANNVRDTDDCNNYVAYIMSVCEIVYKLLTTAILNDDGKRTLISELQTDKTICDNLNKIINNDYDFIEFDNTTDTATNLLQHITKNV